MSTNYCSGQGVQGLYGKSGTFQLRVDSGVKAFKKIPAHRRKYYKSLEKTLSYCITNSSLFKSLRRDQAEALLPLEHLFKTSGKTAWPLQRAVA